jgi:UDPglucose--hexose-1-phosphate uridylyltransferase
MPQLRQDPVSGRWVIVATDRGARPQDFHVGRGRRVGGFCPFCEGNEDRTPPEILAFRPNGPGSRPNGPGWQLRVVPNKFPALQPAASALPLGDGLFRAVDGHGAHEVLIESPRHLVSPTEMSPDQFALVIRAYCERARALSGDPGVSYVAVFKNVGVEAGASIEHAHSQLIAVPVMPKRVAEEESACAAYHREGNGCLFCSIITQETASGERVVLDRDGFVALSPYAARFPFELWVLPREHSAHFQSIDQPRQAALAGVLHEVLLRLETCLKDPPFNYAVHTAPVHAGDFGYYHWHIEIIPRVTHVAGFEWGTGLYINPMEPEEAARHLRDVSDARLQEGLAAARADEERARRPAPED